VCRRGVSLYGRPKSVHSCYDLVGRHGQNGSAGYSTGQKYDIITLRSLVQSLLVLAAFLRDHMTADKFPFGKTFFCTVWEGYDYVIFIIIHKRKVSHDLGDVIC
jgi:hypothetical protein